MGQRFQLVVRRQRHRLDQEKVKRAGGNVTGKLRVSLSWFNHDDLDLHVYEPNGDHIWYQEKRNKLDVDMNASGTLSREPVENVTWTDRVPDGEYRIEVNQYRKRDSTQVGFVVETESNGKIEHYSHERAVGHKETVEVGRMTVAGGVITAFRPGKDVQPGSAGMELWGITTEQFVPVSTIMYSPNYFDDNEVGNRHYFFILKGCVNDQPTRGSTTSSSAATCNRTARCSRFSATAPSASRLRTSCPVSASAPRSAARWSPR
ncbi:hypothetical protein GCM10027614_78980 [Micromonospora vulcania]